MKTLILVAVLAVAAFSQTAVIPPDCAHTRSATEPCIDFGPAVTFKAIGETSTDITIVSKAYCDVSITFGKTKKKIADLFPEECDYPTSGRVKMPDSWPRLETKWDTPDVWKMTNAALANTRTYVDVPASQERYVAHKKGDIWECGDNACIANEDKYEMRRTCADKSRVLLTAEDGKQWCHQLNLGLVTW